MRGAPLYLAMAAILLVSFALNLLYRGFRSRVRRGRYEEGSAVEGPSFVTDHGTFVLNKRARTVDILAPDGRYNLPFDNIELLQLQHRTREAMLEELLFENFSLFDLRRRYRDHVHSYSIVIRTRSGEVPLFEADQYEVRDWLNISVPIQLWLLAKMGFHHKAEEVSAEVLGKIQLQFRRAGLAVNAARW